MLFNTGKNTGTDTIAATVDGLSAKATKEPVLPFQLNQPNHSFRNTEHQEGFHAPWDKASRARCDHSKSKVEVFLNLTYGSADNISLEYMINQSKGIFLFHRHETRSV